MLRLAAWTRKAGKGLPIHSIHKTLIYYHGKMALLSLAKGLCFPTSQMLCLLVAPTPF